MFRSIKFLSRIAITLSLVAITTSCTYQGISSDLQRPAQWAVSVEKEGLGNFYKVSDGLYRGKQPTAQGIAELKKMGIETIVDLRNSHSNETLIGNIDIRCEYIPMHASDPKYEDVVRFLKIVTDKNKTPVFVHCQRGADRTGFMCAAYRIVVCGWSKQDAIYEMTHGGYKFSPLWQDLIRFLKELDVQQIRQEVGLTNTFMTSPV